MKKKEKTKETQLMNGVFFERSNFRLVYLMELWTAKEWQREGKQKETLKTKNKWSLLAG